MKKLGLLLIAYSELAMGMAYGHGKQLWLIRRAVEQEVYYQARRTVLAQTGRTIKDDSLFEDLRYHEQQEAKRKAPEAKKKAERKKYEAKIATSDKKDQ